MDKHLLEVFQLAVADAKSGFARLLELNYPVAS